MLVTIIERIAGRSTCAQLCGEPGSPTKSNEGLTALERGSASNWAVSAERATIWSGESGGRLSALASSAGNSVDMTTQHAAPPLEATKTGARRGKGRRQKRNSPFPPITRLKNGKLRH